MVAFVIAESSQKLGKVGGRGSRTLWVFRCAGAPVSHAKFQLSPPRRCAKLTFLTKVSPRLENVELSGRSMMPSIAPVFRNYTHFGDLQGQIKTALVFLKFTSQKQQWIQPRCSFIQSTEKIISTFPVLANYIVQLPSMH
ncbi:hypothetical protein VTN96DRAFT_4415 [Rasamsonia emersonii]